MPTVFANPFGTLAQVRSAAAWSHAVRRSFTSSRSPAVVRVADGGRQVDGLAAILRCTAPVRHAVHGRSARVRAAPPTRTASQSTTTCHRLRQALFRCRATLPHPRQGGAGRPRWCWWPDGIVSGGGRLGGRPAGRLAWADSAKMLAHQLHQRRGLFVGPTSPVSGLPTGMEAATPSAGHRSAAARPRRSPRTPACR